MDPFKFTLKSFVENNHSQTVFVCFLQDMFFQSHQKSKLFLTYFHLNQLILFMIRGNSTKFGLIRMRPINGNGFWQFI